MDPISWLIDFVLHVDKHLPGLMDSYGSWIYAILFAIVFIETGVVVMPFLPGDSLLFAAGALAATGSFDLPLLFVIFISAALIGDNMNYWIGHYMGPKIFEKDRLRFIKRDYLFKTRAFFKKHGGKTVILGRFVPIIRTFMPFVSGVGEMKYKKFILYDIAGVISWVTLFLTLGYVFGTNAFVQEHFSVVIIAIILISFLPIVAGLAYSKLKKAPKAEPAKKSGK